MIEENNLSGFIDPSSLINDIDNYPSDIYIDTQANDNKRGRRPKSMMFQEDAKHNKYSKDNLLKKIRVKLVKSSINLLNLLYKKYCEQKNIKITQFIFRIRPKFVNLKNKELLEFMRNGTIRIMFSESLSKKFKKCPEHKNKENIEKIYEKGEAKELIEFMNLKIIDAYEIYIGEKENKYLNNFSLDNDIENMPNDSNEEKYKKKYKNVAKGFYKYIVKK